MGMESGTNCHNAKRRTKEVYPGKVMEQDDLIEHEGHCLKISQKSGISSDT
jgi:hypothetical protein